jgi:hypothetical protein
MRHVTLALFVGPLLGAACATLDDTATVASAQETCGDPMCIEGSESAPQLRLQADGQESWLEMAPVTESSMHPAGGMRMKRYPTNGVDNQVWTAGHNLSDEQGKVMSHLQLEYSYKNPNDGPLFSEFHWVWRNADRTTARVPISAIVNWTTETGHWGLQGRGIIAKDDFSPMFLFEPTNGFASAYEPNGGWHKHGNNTGILWGDKTTQGYIEVVRIDTSNRIHLDANQNYAGVSVSSPGGLYIGLGAANINAKLQVDSTTKGALPAPRMTTTQRHAIDCDSANDGLQVHDITLHRLTYCDGSGWRIVSSEAE